MNEEERIRRKILDKMGLGALQIMYDKGIQEGFQKGKLEQKKEELNYWDKLEKSFGTSLEFEDNYYLKKKDFELIRNRIKQLKKEIGEEKEK